MQIECKKKRKRRRIAEFIQEKKNTECFDCGVNYYPLGLMSFDHKERSSKLFNISDGPARTWKQVREEIAKCDVVCRGCHDKREKSRDNLGCKMNREKRRNTKEYSLRFSMINELASELNHCKFSLGETNGL